MEAAVHDCLVRVPDCCSIHKQTKEQQCRLEKKVARIGTVCVHSRVKRNLWHVNVFALAQLSCILFSLVQYDCFPACRPCMLSGVSISSGWIHPSMMFAILSHIEFYHKIMKHSRLYLTSSQSECFRF